MQMPLPREAKEALEKTTAIVEDLKVIRGCLEQLLELELQRAAKE